MDIDIMKSLTNADQQMDMMTMIMQMEKFATDFCCSPQQNLTTIPAEIEFPGTASNEIPPQSMFQNQNVASSSPLMMNQHLSSSMPFVAATQPVQEPVTPPLQPDTVSSGRFRSAGRDAFATQYDKKNSVAAMREMIFRIAVMQPIHIDPESIKPPKRRNVKISKDPQSVAARHRRERISERIRILQRLVPGGTKMDTASMLDEAIHYVKFLKKQVQALEQAGANRPIVSVGFPATMMSNLHQNNFLKGYQSDQMARSMQML